MKILRKAKETDLIVIGGGGLLMDYFTPFWENFRSLLGKVPYCFWGIGFCDIKHENSLPPSVLIEEIVNRSEFCIVRDEMTKNYLSGCNLREPVLCPSVNILKKNGKSGLGILHAVNYTTAGKKAYEAMCNQGKTYAIKSGRQYRETNNLIKKGSELELEMILSLYRDSDIIISSALHGCIIGVATGKRVLAVSGDRKIESFMESVGLGDWVLDLNEINQINQKLNELHKQKDVTDFVEQHRQNNEKVAEQIIRMIKT
jgi:polysaccharide pyruvyl transferase WcaK-like protein